MAAEPTGRIFSPRLLLEPFRPIIWSLYIFEDCTIPATIQKLQEFFPEIRAFNSRQNATGNFPSVPTFKRILREWNFQKYRQRTADGITPSASSPIASRIWVLFYELGLTDTEMLQFLHYEGYAITMQILKRIRIALGLRRRLAADMHHKHNQQMKDILLKQLESGQSVLYGRTLTYQFLRRCGIPVARDRMFAILKEIDPVGVYSRSVNMGQSLRPRGMYCVPGPDYVWSVDGHHKLSKFGIEIYAAIDAYSRYIVWIYVGISTRTAVSVMRQYLEAVLKGGVIPYRIRSDRGTETPMMAEAHCKLHLANDSTLPLTDLYCYGTSTLNQRIESWWRHLSKSQTIVWKDYFENLVGLGLYAGHGDEIALLYVYFPLVREEIYEFANLWNTHRIRRQKDRPFLAAGKPVVLYHTPPSKVSKFGVTPKWDEVDALIDDVGDWDPTEYLPAATLACCRTLLEEINITPERINMSDVTLLDGSEIPIHVAAYTHLRARLAELASDGMYLPVSEVPQGARGWQPRPEIIQELQRSPEFDFEEDLTEEIDHVLESDQEDEEEEEVNSDLGFVF